MYILRYPPEMMTFMMMTFVMMSLTTMATASLTAVTWKPAVTSTWKMKNCSIDDIYKDTTFTVSPTLDGS